MRIINAMPISSITLTIVAFFIQQGCGKEEPAASGILHPEHRHLKQDPAVESSLSMIDGDELTGLSISGSLGCLEYVEIEVATKGIDSKSSKETDSKSSKKGSGLSLSVSGLLLLSYFEYGEIEVATKGIDSKSSKKSSKTKGKD
ncbi:hypothetical protein ACHAW5_010062 [Stephanodiscus triporus]|uniref:Lipoprotein n=1 Tax=Stephanodiscus triporus TaxID=2934178 RepID=A0ABD3QNF3_9STRA